MDSMSCFLQEAGNKKSATEVEKIARAVLFQETMSKNDERETYASTTASPPPVQISLDDSIESEYKDTAFLVAGALMSPNTDFSEEV